MNMTTKTTKRIFSILLAVALIVGVASLILTLSNQGESKGINTRFRDNVQIMGKMALSSGGLFDLNGEADSLILDADGDTTISASTDDTINIELNSADQVVLKAVASANSATTNEYTEIAFTTPIDTTGTNTHNAFTIDLAIGNATGGTNAVRGIQIDAITADAQVTETAINVGTGWDSGLTVASKGNFSYVQGADSGATGDAVEIAFTSPVDTTGTNVHNALTIDLAIGNATGGTNSVVGLQIDGITGDAEVTETAINVGTGWDSGLVLASPMSVSSTADFTYVQGIDAGATGDALEVAFTSPVDTAGTNTHNAITVDLAVGNATGGTNAVRGLQIDSIVGDAQVTETAINVESGWDSGLTVASKGNFSYAQGADSGATGDSVEIAFTSPVDTTGTNVHNALTIDLAIGNATGGTNSVVGLQIDGITGDAEVTETAVNIGSGWDSGLTLASPMTANAKATFAYVQGIDAGTTGDALEVAFTTPVDTAGTNVHNAITIDLAIGNSTGGTNTVVGLQIDGITGDAQVTETAINIGSGWDTDIQVSGKITHATATNEGIGWVLYNTFAYTDTTAKTMFVIPANADIVDVILDINTASSGGGTDDTLRCGINGGSATAYVNDSDADAAADIFRLGVDATLPLTANGDVGGSNVTVECTFVENTGTATAGAFALWMIIRVD